MTYRRELLVTRDLFLKRFLKKDKFFTIIQRTTGNFFVWVSASSGIIRVIDNR